MVNKNTNYLSYFHNLTQEKCCAKNNIKQPHLMVTIVFSIVFIAVLSLGLRFVEDNVINNLKKPFPKTLNPLHMTVARAAEVNNQANFLVQSHEHVRIMPNKGFTFIVKFKNNGNKTWHHGEVYLKSKTTGLKFRHAFWPDPFLPGNLQEASVAPGSEATFKFAVNAPPKFGNYSGDFVLADNNVMIKNGQVSISMEVTDNPESSSANQSSNSNSTNNSSNTTCPYIISTSNASASSNCIPTKNYPGPNIRVGVYYSDDNFIIKNTKPWQLTDSNNKILLNVLANETVSLYFDKNLLNYSYTYSGQTQFSSNYLILENNDDGIWEITNHENRPSWNTSINDNTFKGNLEIRYNNSKNRTWVINELAMEEYLRGIAETSNGSPMEYLKTMAIAARTYAYYHYTKATKHADEYFHVDSTYDQVYKGYNVSLRLTDMQTAIDETNGIVATYEGRPIVAAYFSRSDGKTRSFKEVWGSDVAYLVSVDCPYSEGQDLWGHGVGIDAYDAVRRASEGNATYDEILKYYYTGIELEKMW